MSTSCCQFSPNLPNIYAGCCNGWIRNFYPEDVGHPPNPGIADIWYTPGDNWEDQCAFWDGECLRNPDSYLALYTSCDSHEFYCDGEVLSMCCGAEGRPPTNAQAATATNTACANHGGAWISPSEYAAGARCDTYGACCLNFDPYDCIFTTAYECAIGHVGNEFHPNKACSQVSCRTGCCHCDWCCDMLEEACRNLKGTPLYTGQSCSSPDARQGCSTLYPRRACVHGHWRPVKRPAAHYPPERQPYRQNVFEIASEEAENPIDREPEDEECRKHYGIVIRGVEQGFVRMMGAICNLYGRRRPTQDVRRSHCPVVKKDSHYRFACGYRPPCSEKPSPCIQ